MKKLIIGLAFLTVIGLLTSWLAWSDIHNNTGENLNNEWMVIVLTLISLLLLIVALVVNRTKSGRT